MASHTASLASPTPLAPRTKASSKIMLLALMGAVLVAVLVAAGVLLQRHNRAMQASLDQLEQSGPVDRYLGTTAAEATPQIYTQDARAAATSAPSPHYPTRGAPAQLSPQEAKALRQKLLDHPSITPGDGFDKPGVQATGSAILDAIASAQSR